MQCHDAHQLLELGMVPGKADTTQTLLGFHLASCPSCRSYRRQREERLLLGALLVQPVAAACRSRRRQPSRRPQRMIRAASAALLVGTALGLSPTVGATAAPVRPALASPVQQSIAAVVEQAGRRAVAARLQRGDADALLSELLARPVPAPAEAPLPVGVQITIPTVPQAAPEAAPQAPPAQVVGGSYVIQAGDTLSSIAQRVYGNPNYWYGLQQFNSGVIANANLIYPGQLISTPAAAQLPGYGGAVPYPTQPQTGQGLSANTYHTVQSGETLSSIAVFYYGNAAYYSNIYNANRTILSNANLIYTGQVLYIP